MRSSWKDNFKPSNFGPKHDNPVTFIVSQWQTDKDTPSWLYLIFRSAIFIIFFVIWLLTFILESPAGKRTWAIYLTNWGMTLCSVQSFLSFLMLFRALIEKNIRGKLDWENSVAKLYSAYWVLNVIATTVAFSITFVFWTIIYPAQADFWKANTNELIRIMNFLVHGFNSILMLFDFCMVSHPVRLLHWVYPCALALTYTSMTAIYYVCGGTAKDGSKYIYPILKWDEPAKTIGYCVAIAIFMIIVHIITFFMHLLRAQISKCCTSNPEKNSISDPAETRML